MNCISWNIRGLDCPRKKRFMKNILITDQPDILLIQETRLDMDNLTLLQKSCFKQYNYIVSLATGSARGIMTLWKISQYDLTSSITTKHSITTTLKIIGANGSICVTYIYAPHKVVERIKMLQSISQLLDSIHQPFKIVAGDFNMVLNLVERREASKN